MSVQPIPPTSRQGSHLNTRGERERGTERESTGAAALPATHPYASASATPTTPTANGEAITAGGTFPRTTSNSPLPPIPGDDREGERERERERERNMRTSNSNVALGTTGTYSYANGSAPTMSRGMSVPRMDGLGYGGQGAGGVIEEEPPRQHGFFALLCCKA